MQFIDQAPDYKQKSITLNKAIGLGRAKLVAPQGSEKLLICFRPELDKANAFDRSISKRLAFNELSTPEKLDLLIKELLPTFYHPEFLPLTGQDTWVVHFLVDGSVHRTLQLDAEGIHTISSQDCDPALELETDIMTLMAILRSTIANFHLNPPAVPDLPADEATSIVGGMAVAPARHLCIGDEADVANEGD